MDHLQSITVEAITDNLNEIIKPICAHAQTYGFDNDKVSDIRLAIEEVFVNICNYAYPDRAGMIDVEVSHDDVSFMITITDSGIPFDIVTASDPDLKIEIKDRDIGGMGIYLLKKCMDNVQYRRVDAKNIVTLVKKIHMRKDLL